MKAMPHAVRASFLVLLPAFYSPGYGGALPMGNARRRAQIEADWMLQQ